MTGRTTSRFACVAALSVAALFLAGAAHAQQFIYGNTASGTAQQYLYKIDAATGTVVKSCLMAKGNGRGIVVVGSTVYYTTASNNNVYKTDFATCADNGIAFSVTGAASLSTIAFDGTNLWVGDYTSGSNKAFLYSTTGTLLQTITLPNCTGNCDGLEFFQGKLISNRGDADAGGYDVYSLTGTVITPLFIAPTGFGATGIAFDGTNFIVSDIFNQKLQFYSGTNGAFIKTVTITGLVAGGNLLEDLSADYQITLGPAAVSVVPTMSEWGLILMAALLALAGIVLLRRRNR